MSSLALTSLSPIPEELVILTKCEQITGGDLSVCEETTEGGGDQSEGGSGDESEGGDGESEGRRESQVIISEGECACSEVGDYLECDSPGSEIELLGGDCDSDKDTDSRPGSPVPAEEAEDRAEVSSIFATLKVQLKDILPNDPTIKAKLPMIIPSDPDSGSDLDNPLCSPYNIPDSPSSSPFSTPPDSPRSASPRSDSPRSASPCSIIRANHIIQKEMELIKDRPISTDCYLQPDVPLEVEFDKLDGPLKVQIDECVYTKNDVVLKQNNIDITKPLNFDINASNTAPLNVHILDDRKKALQEHLVINIDRPFASDQPLKVHIEESMIPLYGSMDVLIKYNDKNIMVQLDADLLAKLQRSGPVKVNI